MLNLEYDLEYQIRSHAERTYPYECCGFLIGTIEGETRTIEKLELAINHRSDSPENRYLISPEQFQEVERDAARDGRSIIGFFHSHPDAPSRPSDYDRDHAWPWFSYVIISVVGRRADQLTSWQLVDDRSAFIQEQVSISKVSVKVSN